MDKNSPRSGPHLPRRGEAQRNRRMLARVRELVECGIEAEPEVVEAAKAANPEITEEQLKEVIMLFRDAVYSRQHDR